MKIIHEQKGFTLMEVLIAILLLSGVLLFSAQALFPSLRLIRISGFRSEAAYKAQNLIEQVMVSPGSPVWSSDDRVTMVPDSKITFTKTGDPLSFNISGTKIIVEVKYPDQDQFVSVTGFIKSIN